MSHQIAHLDFWAANPPDGGQLLLEEQVVGLVVEAPLTDHEVRPISLHAIHHLLELLALVVPELAVILN